jgi:FKBP-type peptidyl-prolyl cis-trans isomerase
MKKITSIAAVAMLSLFILISCKSGPFKNTSISSKDDSASYYLGLGYGLNIKQANFDSLFDYDAFIKGIEDAVKADTLPVSQMEMQDFLNGYFADLQANQMEKQYKDHRDENREFMTENGRKDSVISLPSGLQYVVLKDGNGAKPTMNDRIMVHYTGKLIDGTIFDSSYQRNEPAQFIVGQVIPGWVEALQLMSVGSKWRIFIPEELAYGSRAQGAIKPFSTLIFEVELIEILQAE